MHGPLTDVDAKDGVLVLKLLSGPRTIAISPEAKIYANGELATLKDLTVGNFTRVTFTQDQKAVVEVRSGKGVGNYPQPMRKQGILIEMDRDKRLARVFATSAKGDTNMLREEPLAKDATFSLDYLGRPMFAVRMEEITKGLTTHYWLEPVYHRIVHMHLEMPLLVRREVKALDQENRNLTILENDVERVLALSPRVKVLSPRGAGKLDDIVPGAIVDCGLNPDRKQIEVLVVPSK